MILTHQYRSIPSEIGRLTALALLNMQLSTLVGTIPSEIGNLVSLTQLSLAGNELGGTEPSELDQLTNIHIADFYNNDFTGGLETVFCNFTMEFFQQIVWDHHPRQCVNAAHIVALQREENALKMKMVREISQPFLVPIIAIGLIEIWCLKTFVHKQRPDEGQWHVWLK